MNLKDGDIRELNAKEKKEYDKMVAHSCQLVLTFSRNGKVKIRKTKQDKEVQK